MELELAHTELSNPVKVYELNRDLSQRLNERIQSQRFITGLDKKDASPYGFIYPSLANNDVLTDAGTYVLNFNGTKLRRGEDNNKNVLHLFGGCFDFKSYLALTQFDGLDVIFGYGGFILGLDTVRLFDNDKFASLVVYSTVGSLRIKVNVTGSVDSPIIWAKAFELKGTNGIVNRNIPTYFESDSQNTKTQYIQENQVISSDRILAILTKPEILTINVSPLNR